MATDGHALAIYEGNERHFEDDALYEINEKVHLNDDFKGEEHAYIPFEDYPDVAGILEDVQKLEYHHEVAFNVHHLIRMLRFIEKAMGKTQGVKFRFPAHPHRPVTFMAEGIDTCESITGLMMPIMDGYEHAVNYDREDYEIPQVFTDEKIAEIRQIVNDVNNFSLEEPKQ